MCSPHENREPCPIRLRPDLARRVEKETITVILSVGTDRVEEFENGFREVVVAVFATGEGHHEHDSHPGFAAWNKKADEYQIADALDFSGETILTLDA
jgi:hypothetical protein